MERKWYDDSEFEAGIAESVRESRPLVVVVFDDVSVSESGSDGGGESVERTHAATISTTEADRVVKLLSLAFRALECNVVAMKLRKSSAAFSFFSQLFSYDASSRTSVHVVRDGARVALLHTDFAPLVVRDFVARNVVQSNPASLHASTGNANQVTANLGAANHSDYNDSQQIITPLSATSSNSSFVHVDPEEAIPSAEPAATPTKSSTTQPATAHDPTYTLVALKFSHDTIVRSRFFRTDTLAVIRAFIKKSGFVADFELVQPYPMKVFTPSEEERLTLADLGLTPTGSLVVKKCISKPITYRTKKKSGPSSSPSSSTESVPAKVYDTSALSIRLPDGATIRLKLAATDRFATVRKAIAEDTAMGSVSGAFEMTQLYPARVFSPADEESTLKDLDLVPSASLVVKYLHGTASSYPSIGSDNSVVASFVRPFQALLAWLAALFTWIATRVQGGSTVSHTGASISVDRNALADSGDSAGADVGATSSSSSSSSGAANAKFSSLAELRRRQQREGKEKDNSTYNGNSTAQDF